MPRFHRIDGVDVPFTSEEETARDAVEAQFEIDVAIWLVQEERLSILKAKLTDDSIAFEEMKELMRLRG